MSYPPTALDIWTIYDSPSDYQGRFVARRWVVPPGKPTGEVFLGETLDEVRDLLPPGLTRLERHENDDIVIVETWL